MPFLTFLVPRSTSNPKLEHPFGLTLQQQDKPKEPVVDIPLGKVPPLNDEWHAALHLDIIAIGVGIRIAVTQRRSSLRLLRYSALAALQPTLFFSC